MYNNYQKKPQHTGQPYGNGDALQIAKQIFNQAGFKNSWITDCADKDLPVFAETMGKEMADGNLTSSKIRNIYGEIKRIQMGSFEKEKAAFYLLRPKVAYAYGRETENKGLALFKIVFDHASEQVADKKTYTNFCNLIEAILAYHRVYKKSND